MKDLFIIILSIISFISIVSFVYLVLYLKAMAKLYKRNHIATYSHATDNMGKIIFIGDSHTEFYKTHVYFNKYKILNVGIAGDTTKGVLSRLQANVIDLKPKKVFIQIGINDFARGSSSDEIYDNIISIAGQIKNSLPQTAIYVISLYPVNRNIYSFSRLVLFRRHNNNINKINYRLKLNSDKGLYRYIDVARLLKNSFGNLAKQYTIEGLHLNTNAYQAISEVLEPYLSE